MYCYRQSCRSVIFKVKLPNLCCSIASKVVHFVFEAGEENKHLGVIENIYEKLILEKI